APLAVARDARELLRGQSGERLLGALLVGIGRAGHATDTVNVLGGSRQMGGPHRRMRPTLTPRCDPWEGSRVRPLRYALVVLLARPARAGASEGRSLRADAGGLVDRHGNEVTLRGVNARAAGVFDVTFDDGRLPLEDIPGFDDGDAARMRDLG